MDQELELPRRENLTEITQIRYTLKNRFIH